MPKTKLTKTGQPVLGTTVAIMTVMNVYEPVKVVDKGWGKDGHTLVQLIVEWEDGWREPIAANAWRIWSGPGWAAKT